MVVVNHDKLIFQMRLCVVFNNETPFGIYMFKIEFDKK